MSTWDEALIDVENRVENRVERKTGEVVQVLNRALLVNLNHQNINFNPSTKEKCRKFDFNPLVWRVERSPCSLKMLDVTVEDATASEDDG